MNRERSIVIRPVKNGFAVEPESSRGSEYNPHDMNVFGSMVDLIKHIEETFEYRSEKLTSDK